MKKKKIDQDICYCYLNEFKTFYIFIITYVRVK